MTVTDRQRAEWREDVAQGRGHGLHEGNRRILALLDALEFSEQTTTNALEALAQSGSETAEATARAESAESERDSLAVQLDAALGKVARVKQAIIDAAPPLNAELRYDGREEPVMAAYVEGFHDAYEAASAALAGPSPTDEESR